MSTPTPSRCVNARATVASLLGFVPEDSLVLLPTTGKGPAARVDLAPLFLPSAATHVRHLTSTLARLGVSEIVVAYFTERDPADLACLDTTVTEALADAGLRRTSTRVFDDRPDGMRRRDVAAITPATCTSRRHALTTFRMTAPDIADYVRALDLLTTGGELTASAIGAAGACLTSVHLRDAVIVQLAGLDLPTPGQDGRPRLPEDLAGRAIRALLEPGRRSRPARSLADHRALLIHVIAHLPAGEHAPARTLLALLAWSTGQGATANRHLEEALKGDPEYRLAQLVRLAFAHPADFLPRST